MREFSFDWRDPGAMTRVLERGLYGALVTLIAVLPIYATTIRGWGNAVLPFVVIPVFALLAGWLVLWALGAARISEPLRRAWPAFVLLALWLLHVAITIVPMPAEWVAFLSPEAARMYANLDLLGKRPATAMLSIDPYATRVGLVMSLAYCGLFFLFLALVNSRARVLTAARAIVYAAVLHAIYAVLMHLADVKQVRFDWPVPHGDSASGFYYNRNHFAGMLEMTLSLGIGLLIAGLSERWPGSWRTFFIHLIEWILSPKMLLRLSLCILVIALTTTHSRMGNTAFFSALLIAGAIGIALSRLATRKTVLLLASLVVLDLAIVGSWFGVEKLAARIEATTMVDVREREMPAVYSVALIRDYPVFGTGLGSFMVAFPRYGPEFSGGTWAQAHNDFAQFAAETGLVGFGLLGLVIVYSLGAALRAQWVRRDPLMRGMSFACIMGVTSILIHSWTDFNLQIPANAAYFMVLLALGWISLHLDRAG